MPEKIFLDTEFTGLHQQTSLISIGLAATNGSVFYAEFSDYNSTQITNWHVQNVIPALSGNLPKGNNITRQDSMFVQGDQDEIGELLRTWFKQFGGAGSVEIWADVMAWDWVLFCELFGGAFGIPEQINYIPRDLSTWLLCKHINPDTDRESLAAVHHSFDHLKMKKHHALYDALLEMEVYNEVNNQLPW